MCVSAGREVGVVKKVERELVIDNEGRAVVLTTETTGVVVENEEGRGVAVQTAVHGVVLGNILGLREPNRVHPIEAAPTITEPAHNDDDDDDDDGCCSCCCVIKWTLISICCLPCLPFICIWYCCCRDDD